MHEICSVQYQIKCFNKLNPTDFITDTYMCYLLKRYIDTCILYICICIKGEKLGVYIHSFPFLTLDVPKKILF